MSQTPKNNHVLGYRMLWTAKISRENNMSGGLNCPPYEDKTGNFRVPNNTRNEERASNWLRTTYQIDNNAAGTKL